jgi:NADH-quinone oxidoreductase subunit M
MLGNIPLLSIILFSPLLGILVLLFIPADRGRELKIAGMAATVIPLILSAWLYADYLHRPAGSEYTEQAKWIHLALNHEALDQQVTSFSYDFAYHLAVDGLSLPLVFLTALISTMAALASVHIKKRWKSYYILFLLLEIGMFGVFMARDLFLFFLFFEATLFPVYFLVGIWGYKERERAAMKYLIYNGIGSALMLIAFFVIVTTAGLTQTSADGGLSVTYSGDLNVIMNNLFHDSSALVNLQPEGQQMNPFYLSSSAKWGLFFLLLVAFGIKLPIFPFHTWMLKVHTEASPSIVMIHSGILLKMGAYGLIRFGILLFPAEAREWATALAILGVINILYGAVLAFVQNDFKLVLAYSSISHMGIVLLGLAAFNSIGLEGAVFQMVSHGLISALLFLIVGSLYERTGTTVLGRLGGLARPMPFLSGILLVAGMASLGLPGLSGFISEFLAFLGLFSSARAITIVGTLGIILAAAYVLRGVLKMTFGPTPDRLKPIRDARLIEAVPMIALTAFIVLLGIYPGILSHPLEQTVSGFDLLMQNLNTKMGG